jgi:hypothetical protein
MKLKLKNKMFALEAKIYLAVLAASDKLRSFADDERGDTNFISIIVVLGIVLLVAGAFMLFKDQIIGKAQEIIESFTIH